MLIDGAVVGTFTPAGSSYSFYNTAAFTVTAGSHTITFQGLDSTSGNTSFVDDIRVFAVSAGQPGDAGFESPMRRHEQLPVRPERHALDLHRRVSGHRRQRQRLHLRQSPGAEGGQVALLQGVGSFSQAVAGWAAGSYTISFDAAQRGSGNASHQNFEVLIDGTVVGTLTPAGPDYATYTTAAFNVTAGSHTITFQGLDTAGGDNTALVDDIRVAAAGLAPGDAGFELPMRRRRTTSSTTPSGTPWTFSSGTAGIASNGSAFTSANPTGARRGPGRLPPGRRLVQPGGRRLGRRLLHHLLLRGAARTGNASQQNFEVLIDGTVVGTFTPAGSGYAVYTTAAFTVTAGSHTITFQGLDTPAATTPRWSTPSS